MKVRKYKKITYKSYVPKVKTDAWKAERNALSAGASYLRKEIRNTLSQTPSSPSSPGQPPAKVRGYLYQGVTTKMPRGASFKVIGFVSPASHAHLLEFGTPNMEPRPFFVSTFIKEYSNAQRKMRERYKKIMHRELGGGELLD